MPDIELTSAELTRPIIGIENRTPQEVFDIMCDRVRHSLARAGLGAGKAEESMRHMGWFVRHDPGCEWQYYPCDPDRSLAVRNWERKRAFIDEPAIRALPLTGASHDQARD